MRSFCFVAVALCLAACGKYVETYVPEMTGVPSDQSKFDSDLNLCRNEAQARNKAAIENNRLRGMFGAAGGIGADDDYTKSQFEMIDECMQGKGHPVKIVHRYF